MVHALIVLLPYLLDKPFELPVHTGTNGTSLQWQQQQQQQHVTHH